MTTMRQRAEEFLAANNVPLGNTLLRPTSKQCLEFMMRFAKQEAARLAPQPAPGPQVDVRELTGAILRCLLKRGRGVSVEDEPYIAAELRKHLSAAPEVKE